MGAPMMMAVLITQENAKKWPSDPKTFYKAGQNICVTGDVTKNSFTGGPQIYASDPSQIVVQP